MFRKKFIKYNYDLISEKGSREINEDHGKLIKVGDAYCFVVCDGLGGHSSGELASKTVANSIIDDFKNNPCKDQEIMAGLIDQANNSLLLAQNEDFKLKDMKTTLVLLCAYEGKVRFAHVGDSRLYMFRGGKLFHQTKDHSVPQMLVDMGEIKPEDMRHHEDRNRLTKVMGTQWDRPQYVISDEIALEDGDAFLLCTDGFWENIEEDKMEEILNTSKHIRQALKKMKVEILSNADSNLDNFTGLLVTVGK